jgi:hypothetical protein
VLPKGCEYVDVGVLDELNRVNGEIAAGKHKWLFE